MMRQLLRFNFAKQMIFESKKGKKVLFEKNIPKRDFLKTAQDPACDMAIHDRLQLLFERYKTEKTFKQMHYDEIENVKEKFLKQSVQQKHFFYFVNTRFLREQHPNYFHFQCTMIDEYLKRFENMTTENQIHQIITSISEGLFYVEKKIFSPSTEKQYSQEIEDYIVNIFFKLCDRIEVNLTQDKAVRTICQMMKYTKRYHHKFLDRINQTLLTANGISLENRIYYTLILVKAGSQYFPEIVYKMRDDILKDPQLHSYHSTVLFNYFEIFGRTRLPLTQLALAKLFTTISQNAAYHKLKPQQRILLLYYTSKSSVIGSEKLIPFIEELISSKLIIKGVTLKIFLLTLYNMNYQNLITLKQLGEQNFKQQLEEVSHGGHFTPAESKYINHLINIL